MDTPRLEVLEAMDREELQARLADVKRRTIEARQDEVVSLLRATGRIELALSGKPEPADRLGKFEQDVERFLANRIRSGRALARMSQADLARAAGLSTSQLSRIETSSRKLTVAELIRVAIALRQPLTSFTYPDHPEAIGTGWEAGGARV